MVSSTNPEAPLCAIISCLMLLLPAYAKNRIISPHNHIKMGKPTDVSDVTLR